MGDIGELIKERRLYKKMTLKDVAEKTGLSIGFLSQVERNKSSITLQTISKISDALEVSRTYFFKDDKNFGEPATIQKNDLKVNNNIHSPNFVYQSLAGVIHNPVFEPMIVILLPSEKEDEPSTHNGQEFVYVLEGYLTVIIGEEQSTIGPGSSFHISSSTSHTWYNKTSEPTKLLYVFSHN